MEIEKTGNRIIDLTFEFALQIIEYAELLEENRKFVVSNQILKSGTSIGAKQGKHKTVKAKLILSTNSKLRVKKLMKRNIGYYCANILKITPSTMTSF